MNNIHCSFKAVNSVGQTPNSAIVSCIYWEEKEDFFITSVDCIYLLEALISMRFTVEEKNRIRRNLEGFRPLTVSKCRADSARFFKLIMSFPSPKPRNIERGCQGVFMEKYYHLLSKRSLENIQLVTVA